ncbi:hypothetical protein L484_025604 [Morus notabilis]|uniref:Uncharacterized protein n=1 Tax=Morus notabilis TaxID=981085 RepID=W9R8Q5_9ROSA|nr:hypothetical protein L484_025604 [Morus notabilis]
MLLGKNGKNAVGIVFYNLASTFSGRRTEFVHSKSVLEAERMATKYAVKTTSNYKRESDSLVAIENVIDSSKRSEWWCEDLIEALISLQNSKI